MANDVIFNKIAIMERCLIRVKEVYNDNTENLKDFTKQDAIILNIQRACEAALQLAMHIVSEERSGLPQLSEDAFDRLLEEDIISQRTVIRLEN
ncbi:HepT-like ribonuclease domain-containing protein [Oceanobacillus sp. FSL W7-1281]|uniref:type VII toxin-antitoxin system HepT family RNase toxin n=1 Tax=Oceanobacillus sp. FSL W7-1281 TaxID=2921698 RepID=UPI0030D96887